MYKRLEIKDRPLKLLVKTEEFTEEWLSCVTDKKSDLSKLLRMMEPSFSEWSNLLRKKSLDHIFTLALAKMISSDPETALTKINQWLKWIDNNSTIVTELQYIFIERVRKIRYKPILAKPFAIELLVVKDFRMGLYHHLRTICRLMEREATYYKESSDYDMAVTFITPDYFIIKNIIDNNKWNSYLFHLIGQGYSSVKRAELTNIDRRNLHTKEKRIWESLRKMP